jgi:hypothetical protein
MLPDTNIISTPLGRHTVQGQRFEIMFPDGSTLGLHPVLHDGTPQMFLRALRHGPAMLIVFDLRDVCKALDAEIRKTATRDVPGLVFYTLRAVYDTANECAAVMMGKPIDVLQDATARQMELIAA